MNKKGFANKIMIFFIMFLVLAGIMLLVFIGGLALPVLIGTTSQAGDILTETFQTSGNSDLATAGASSFTPAINSLNNLEWVSYTIFVLMFMVFIIMCFYVRTYPFLIFIWIILIVVLAIISLYLAISYQDLRQDSVLGSYYKEWENTDYILQYLPGIVIVLGITGGLVMGIISAKEGGEETTGI